MVDGLVDDVETGADVAEVKFGARGIVPRRVARGLVSSDEDEAEEGIAGVGSGVS